MCACTCTRLFPPPLSDNTYIEVLDGTRVHPETYEWARKMAVDALEYDEVQVHVLTYSKRSTRTTHVCFFL